LLSHLLKGYHPILEDETNCEVLARNLGMCTMCTATMTILGYKHRATYSELTAKFFGSKDAMKPAGFERRLQKYHPGGQQCALLFCAYQCKNTYECFQHIEEPINLLHHSVSAFIAWLSLHPGGIHFYVVASSFCEIPAMISSIYINFDDGFLLGSIPGLGAAFPKTKFVFSIASGISFILFRVCFWFFLMFHYVLDMRRAMNSKRPSAQKFKFWLPAFLLCAIILFYVNVILFTTVIRYIPKVLGNLLKERI